MRRITDRHLSQVVTQLNLDTRSPDTYGTKKDGGGLDIHIGHYHVDSAYGGNELVRTMNTGGGIEVISRGGYIPKRELYYQISALLDGIYIGAEV